LPGGAMGRNSQTTSSSFGAKATEALEPKQTTGSTEALEPKQTTGSTEPWSQSKWCGASVRIVSVRMRRNKQLGL
ncbi:hypothetical protein U1Q18_049446, partial [Sarracenia purpurea var. burkii]